jgi:Flp pilus assembly protein TadD
MVTSPTLSPVAEAQARPVFIRAVLGLSLVIVVLALFDPVRKFHFVNYDDDVYINSHVAAGLNWANLRWAFTTFANANWHPLTWLSHMLDCQLFGLNPAGPHYVNLLLHAFNALLVFLALGRSTRRWVCSFCVAALFAVHPVSVGSLAWVAERKNLLSTTFWWLAIWAYANYVQRPTVQRYLWVAILFALGLMSKPMAVTLPFLLLLLDYWPLQRPDAGWRRLFAEKIPLIALGGADGLLTLLAQHSGGAVRSVASFSLRARLENAVVSYVAYTGKAFWPTRLAVFYPFRSSFNPVLLAASAIYIVAISYLALHERRKRPWLFVGWSWFLITLLPVIGIIQVGDQGMADRYMYLPIIGLGIITVFGAAELARHFRTEGAAAALAIIVFCALATDAREQLQWWNSSTDLWTHAIWATGNNTMSDVKLGEAWRDAGRPDLAIAPLRAAVNDNSGYPAPHYNLAVVLLETGEFKEALNELQTAEREAASTDAGTRALIELRMGQALFQLGRLAESESHLREAARLAPAEMNVQLQLGLTLQKESKISEALDVFSRSIALLPTDFAHLHRAECLEQLGRFVDAAQDYRKVLAISTTPENIAEARQHLQELEKGKPGSQ